MLKLLFKQATELTSLLDEKYETDIISWACPIPFFGNISRAKIATLGINPSNLEFVDDNGLELKSVSRRFNNLHSLNLNSWKDANENHLSSIINDCTNYFNRNPYDRWFKKLDYLISGTSYSYYFPSGEACHLDLVPYATKSKWSTLSTTEQKLLLNKSIPILFFMLENFHIEALILNGQSVVNQFEKMTNCVLNKESKPQWNLRRDGGEDVLGYSYKGSIELIENKPVKILGFNHNIQSSFGVTKEVQDSIRKWITEKI